MNIIADPIRRVYNWHLSADNMKNGHKRLVLIIVALCFSVGVGAYLRLLNRPNISPDTYPAEQEPEKTAGFPTPVPDAADRNNLPPPAYEMQPKYSVDGLALPGKVSKSVNGYFVSASAVGVDKITGLAKNFGFTSPPTVTKSGGTTSEVLFSENGRLFSSGGNPVSVAYTAPTQNSKAFSEILSNLLLFADGYLRARGLPPSPLGLSYTGSVYFNARSYDEPPVSRLSGATMAQLNFQYYLDGLPIYADNPDIPSVALRLNADKEVALVRAYIYPDFIRSEHQIPVISPDEAVRRLVSHQGVLVNIGVRTGNSGRMVIPEPPEMAEIKNIDLAYYFNPDLEQPIPVYVFRGTGKADLMEIEVTSLVDATGN